MTLSVDLLELGWEESYDESFKRKYYYNHTTGESQWQKPTLEAAPLLGRNMKSSVQEFGIMQAAAIPDQSQTRERFVT